MNAADFLGLLLPEQGFIVIAEPITIPGLNHQPFKHHVFSELAPALRRVADLNFEHKNVFFALAGFCEERTWNPRFKNPDGTLGKWQTRTQANAGWLRSLFLDLDVDPSPDSPEKAAKVFPSKEEAAAALRRLCKAAALPRPMVVDSGGGLHAYWPLDRDLPRDEWQPLADKLKSLCVAEQLRIDPAVPADAARVLRVLGCHNLKRDTARPVTLLLEGTVSSPEHLARCFANYEAVQGALPAPRRAYAPPAGVGALESNMGREFTPVSFGNVAFACAVVGGQVACGGAGTSEPLWRATIGIAKFASDRKAALLSVSDQHASFSESEMLEYADRWQAGPTTCAYFHQKLGCAECASCPHFSKITSPAQLGNMVVEAATPMMLVADAETGEQQEIPLPSPPVPYVRRRNLQTGVDEIAIRSEDANGVPFYVPVCPNDIYPVKILRQTISGEVQEKTQWRFHLARMAPVTLEVPQGILSDTKTLHKFLMNVGVYANTQEAAATKEYMSAYLKKLASEVDRERIITRLGWQDSRDAFVVGNRLVQSDGSIVACNPSQSVRNTVKDGLHTRGTLADWAREVNAHYAGDEYRSHRFFLYCAFAAPLYHMTLHKGVLITAAGKSGRGKTTVLKVGSSIWGHPEALILNGNPSGSTTNAMYNHLSTLHSLPMMWDDVTERPTEQMTEFALNITQGKGKERMKGSEHDGKVQTWETMVLSSANYDNIASTLATRTDAQPHLMRMIGVSFDEFSDTTQGKIAADQFISRMYDNYGHAGAVFMQYVVRNYERVAKLMKWVMRKIDMRTHAKAHERYWTAVVAAAIVAGLIAKRVGALQFPLKTDVEWMLTHLQDMRELHASAEADPTELLAGFLEANIGSTLALSSKHSSNLDNITLRPHGKLSIRHEVDKSLIFIARHEVARFCAEQNMNMKEWAASLTTTGVLVDASKLKTLGADTTFAKGQVRCWVVDATQLGARFANAFQQAAAAARVVPLRPTGT
jgi:energy-coupling factor transporter ATP-binding protein EcfA2